MHAKVQSLLSQSAESFYTLGREMLEAGEDVSAGACFVAHRKLLALQEFGQGRQTGMPFAAEGQPFDKPKPERKPRKKKGEGTIDAPYEAEPKAEAKAATVATSAANGNAGTTTSMPAKVP